MTQFFPVLQEEASELQRLRFQVAEKTALCTVPVTDPTPAEGVGTIHQLEFLSIHKNTAWGVNIPQVVNRFKKEMRLSYCWKKPARCPG
jgi:hypothetical protein